MQYFVINDLSIPIVSKCFSRSFVVMFGHTVCQVFSLDLGFLYIYSSSSQGPGIGSCCLMTLLLLLLLALDKIDATQKIVVILQF